MRKILNKIYFWWYRRKHDIPHPQEINWATVKPLHFRELAKLYCSGFTLDQCVLAIAAMKMPFEPPRYNSQGARLPSSNVGARLFLGKLHTRERLRQIIWKIWRDQRVARKP